MERIVEVAEGLFIDLEKISCISLVEYSDRNVIYFSKDDFITIKKQDCSFNIVTIWKDYHCNKFIHSRNFENND